MVPQSPASRLRRNWLLSKLGSSVVPFQCWDGDFWSVNGGKVGCETTRKTTHSCHWHASMDSSTCSSVACNHLTFFLKRFCNKYSRTFRGLSLAATDLRDWTVVLGLNFVVLFDLFSFFLFRINELASRAGVSSMLPRLFCVQYVYCLKIGRIFKTRLGWAGVVSCIVFGRHVWICL